MECKLINNHFNYGIELLRIVSMIKVIILHILLGSGILDT